MQAAVRWPVQHNGICSCRCLMLHWESAQYLFNLARQPLVSIRGVAYMATSITADRCLLSGHGITCSVCNQLVFVSQHMCTEGTHVGATFMSSLIQMLAEIVGRSFLPLPVPGPCFYSFVSTSWQPCTLFVSAALDLMVNTDYKQHGRCYPS